MKSLLSTAPFQRLCLLTLAVTIGSQTIASDTSDANLLQTGSAANWLNNSDSHQHQAVALLLIDLQTESAEKSPEFRQGLFKLIEESQSADTLALVTLVCHNAKLIDDCRDAGLEQSLVDYANGNLMLRGLLLAQTDDWRRAIMEYPVANDVMYSLAKSINDALLDYLSANNLSELRVDAAEQAIAIAMAVPAPLRVFTELCETPAERIAEPCNAALVSMAAPRNSVITRVSGLAMQRDMFARADDLAQAATVEQQRAELWMRYTCLTHATQEVVESRLPADVFKEFIDTSANSGELAAFELLNDRFNLACPSPF